LAANLSSADPKQDKMGRGDDCDPKLNAAKRKFILLKVLPETLIFLRVWLSICS